MAFRIFTNKFVRIDSHIRIRNFSSAREDTDKLNAATKYCSDLVKKHDRENFIISVFYPKHLNNVFLAIRAFDIELAMIRYSVSNSQIGRMRMQFWRDAIDNTFQGRPPQQPIARMLHSSLETCQLSPLFFKRIIDEREASLNDPPYITTKDLESYGENTASCLLYLHLESLGIKGMQADHAASHVGKAIGIIKILRGFSYSVGKRRISLPSEITAKYNISQEEIFRSGPVKGLEDAIFEVATLANDHLLTARTFLPNIPNKALPALLLAVPCDSFLKRLEKYNFNIFEPKLTISDWKLPFNLWYNFKKGTF
ncbi:4797_t:CDS:2 [Funneliformis mosseae]|uniref:4797_t:CDS:1 n=1 Tax=Funneliformis mosseae TaxID=27381 RepID=A0A9N8VWG5_FUNMO|nr:4797_t:CDS:2 [Funneliformis mosseae]